MAKGRQRHEWAMAAAIQATQANTMRGRIAHRSGELTSCRGPVAACTEDESVRWFKTKVEKWRVTQSDRAGRAYVEIYGDQEPADVGDEVAPQKHSLCVCGPRRVGGVIGGLIASGITSAFSAVTSFASNLGEDRRSRWST